MRPLNHWKPLHTTFIFPLSAAERFLATREMGICAFLPWACDVVLRRCKIAFSMVLGTGGEERADLRGHARESILTLFV